MIYPSEPSRERVKVSHVIVECRVIDHHPNFFVNVWVRPQWRDSGTVFQKGQIENSIEHIFRILSNIYFIFDPKQNEFVCIVGGMEVSPLLRS